MHISSKTNDCHQDIVNKLAEEERFALVVVKESSSGIGSSFEGSFQASLVASLETSVEASFLAGHEARLEVSVRATKGTRSWSKPQGGLLALISWPKPVKLRHK